MKTHGFTLVELSIVLVIIGLLAGGILVGRDLIRAAEIRGTISQLEKFNTAATTFKLKYGSLPGDMHPSNAAAFGFFEANNANSYGNGLINPQDVSSIYEPYIFWRHLSDASLIQGQFGKSSTNPLTTSGLATNEPDGYWKLFLPEVTAAKNISWNVSGPSYRYLPNGQLRTIQKNSFFMYNTIEERTDHFIASPILLYTIDSKIDDGKPNTGNMIDFFASRGYWAETPTAGNCTYGGANHYSPDTKYITDPSMGGNEGGCMPLIETIF